MKYLYIVTKEKYHYCGIDNVQVCQQIDLMLVYSSPCRQSFELITKFLIVFAKLLVIFT